MTYFLNFAVGAPGAENNRGRVYIFCGEAGGLSEQPCQVLNAADDSHEGLGWALTSGSGFLAVSRLNPHTVAVYRRRKVLLPHLQLISDTLLPLVGVEVVPVKVCLNYTIRNGELDSINRKFEGHLELDVGNDISRLQFEDLEASNRSRIFEIEAKAGEMKCKPFGVRRKVEENAVFYYELKANASLLADLHPDVVQDPLLALEAQSTLRPALTCDGAECITEVVVSMQHEAPIYIYETSENFYLDMSVVVSKDPAYFPELHLDTGGDLSYSAVQGSSGVECEGATDIVCYFDTLEDSQTDLKIVLLPSQELRKTITGHRPNFTLKANFSSFSDFSATSKPTATLDIPVQLNFLFDLAG
ncbi:hypothetical protein FHG87_020771 [Trinorchestia longiramus]|nr:hypothetical protein FHG87_020771 [Trinorchestia longiramus]